MEYYTETKHPQVSPEYLERLDLREYKNNTTILYLLCNEAEFKNKTTAEETGFRNWFIPFLMSTLANTLLNQPNRAPVRNNEVILRKADLCNQ